MSCPGIKRQGISRSTRPGMYPQISRTRTKLGRPLWSLPPLVGRARMTKGAQGRDEAPGQGNREGGGGARNKERERPGFAGRGQETEGMDISTCCARRLLDGRKHVLSSCSVCLPAPTTGASVSLRPWMLRGGSAGTWWSASVAALYLSMIAWKNTLSLVSSSWVTYGIWRIGGRARRGRARRGRTERLRSARERGEGGTACQQRGGTNSARKQSGQLSKSGREERQFWQGGGQGSGRKGGGLHANWLGISTSRDLLMSSNSL